LVKELSNLTGISIFEIGIKSETNVNFGKEIILNEC
jgi:hypothetical protein